MAVSTGLPLETVLPDRLRSVGLLVLGLTVTVIGFCTLKPSYSVALIVALSLFCVVWWKTMLVSSVPVLLSTVKSVALGPDSVYVSVWSTLTSVVVNVPTLVPLGRYAVTVLVDRLM